MIFSVVFILFRTKDYEKSLNELQSLNTIKSEMNERRFKKLKETVDGMILSIMYDL